MELTGCSEDGSPKIRQPGFLFVFWFFFFLAQTQTTVTVGGCGTVSILSSTLYLKLISPCCRLNIAQFLSPHNPSMSLGIVSHEHRK